MNRFPSIGALTAFSVGLCSCVSPAPVQNVQVARLDVPDVEWTAKWGPPESLEEFSGLEPLQNGKGLIGFDEWTEKLVMAVRLDPSHPVFNTAFYVLSFQTGICPGTPEVDISDLESTPLVEFLPILFYGEGNRMRIETGPAMAGGGVRGPFCSHEAALQSFWDRTNDMDGGWLVRQGGA